VEAIHDRSDVWLSSCGVGWGGAGVPRPLFLTYSTRTHTCSGSSYNLFSMYKCFVMVVCILCSTCISICSVNSYNLFGTYKCFVSIVCMICSTCKHNCSDSSYNLFGTYKYFCLNSL
jgi:hypothetical protein